MRRGTCGAFALLSFATLSDHQKVDVPHSVFRIRLRRSQIVVGEVGFEPTAKSLRGRRPTSIPEDSAYESRQSARLRDRVTTAYAQHVP
jgi:hypothetical protein